MDENSYKKACESPDALALVKRLGSEAKFAEPGARLVRIQHHPALYKYLISPVTVKERPGPVFVMMYECRLTLETAAEKLVRRLGENRLPAMDMVAVTAILSLDAEWFTSRSAYILLGVYAPPNSRVVQPDSFFALFPLFDREVLCFRLMAPKQTSADTVGYFQVRFCLNNGGGIPGTENVLIWNKVYIRTRGYPRFET